MPETALLALTNGEYTLRLTVTNFLDSTSFTDFVFKKTVSGGWVVMSACIRI